MKLTLKRLSLAIASVGLLTIYGCGGGGGRGDETPSQLQVSGVVAKGLATGAKVKIYAITNGVKGALLGQGTTTTGGTYAFGITKPTGPVLIEADLAGADIEDENNPGTTYKGVAGDVLFATVITSSSATTQAINVTPFSHIAAAFALDKGLTAENILAANAVVRQILNNTDFLTASPSTGTLLAQLTQLSEQAVSESGVSTIQALLTALKPILVVNTDGKVDVSDTFATALCGQDTTCQGGFASESEITPVAPAADLSDIEKARALFQSLFDTVSALVNNGKTGDLDIAGAKLENAANQAISFVDNDQLDLLGLATQQIGLLERFKSNQSSSTEYSNSFGFCELAALTGVATDGKFTAETASITPVIATNANALICRSNNARRPATLTIDNVTYTSPLLRNQLVLLQDGSNYSDFKYVSRVRGAATDGDTSRRFNVGSLKYGTIALRETSTQATASFIGQLAPSIVQFGMTDRATYLHNDINLSLTVQGTAVGDVFTPSSAAFSPNGFIKLVKSDNTEASALNIVSGTVNTTSGSLVVNGTAPGLKIEGALSASNVNQTAGTGTVSFTGTIYESATALSTDYRKLLEGRVTANATGADTGNVKFVGELTVANRQPVGVTVDSSYSGTTETNGATFYWSGNSFSLANSASGLLVTNSNGVKFTYIDGSASDIFVGNVLVGSIDTNRRVSFKDGAFIQF